MWTRFLATWGSSTWMSSSELLAVGPGQRRIIALAHDGPPDCLAPKTAPGPGLRRPDNAADPPGRIRPGVEHAELVALRVGQHHPADVGLPDVGGLGTGRAAAPRAALLVDRAAVEVDVDAVLGQLGGRRRRRTPAAGRVIGVPVSSSGGSTTTSSGCSYVIGHPVAVAQNRARAAGSAASKTTECRRVGIAGDRIRIGGRPTGNYSLRTVSGGPGRTSSGDPRRPPQRTPGTRRCLIGSTTCAGRAASREVRFEIVDVDVRPSASRHWAS